MIEPVVAYFDGLVEPTNPGGYACGGWLTRPHDECPPMNGYRCYGHGEGMTNNIAEYNAALDCLRAIVRTGYDGPVMLIGDSQLVVKQFTGEFGCYKPHLQTLLKKLHKAETFFDALTLHWVPRHENAEADALSRRAYREATGKNPPTRHR